MKMKAYRKNDMTTNIIGGAPGYIAKLSMSNKNTAVENGRTFSQWSGSVKTFPKVIQSKLRPLHELVKEVSCAVVKKTYLSEKHPCHCRECQNNGLCVQDNNVCKCLCKPGTKDQACEHGTPQDEQPETLCALPQLPPDVTGSPWKLTYNIGEAVSLSCPEGTFREGPAEIQCNAGLSWSPQPKETRCLTVFKSDTVPVQCQPWENLAKDKCVCKVPHECKSFLEICATDEKRGRTRTLSLCTEDQPVATSLIHHLLWETCDEQTNSCCWKTSEECSSLDAWIHVCVQQEGASAPVTMTECEAAVRKCKGEAVRIVSIQPSVIISEPHL